ncbi:hypothetical protein RND71_007664 [Anisodus tanguticus]|uniref:Uncharacterized protein n=1 Tax=Anisodus tanguticus TaxID=243964 RepID=A0AAE1VTQ5_9SOLA|nr:hypothetical protein RND71_007664 [Anisodus tanguticus]
MGHVAAETAAETKSGGFSIELVHPASKRSPLFDAASLSTELFVTTHLEPDRFVAKIIDLEVGRKSDQTPISTAGTSSSKRDLLSTLLSSIGSTSKEDLKKRVLDLFEKDEKMECSQEGGGDTQYDNENDCFGIEGIDLVQR